MAPSKLQYHQENGDVSYLLSSDSLGNSSNNTEEESFLEPGKCALEGYSNTSRPILDEAVIQLPHLDLPDDMKASEDIADELLNDNRTKMVFTSEKKKLEYKKQILQLLDANRCVDCYNHNRQMLANLRDYSVLDFMKQSFLDKIQQSTADSFLMVPYFLSNENNKLKLKPLSSLPRRMQLVKDSWIITLGIVGKLLAAKQSTTGKKQFGLRTVFYIPESLGRQSILSDDKQTNSLLSQLKGVAKILEQRLPEKIMEDLNKSETKRLSAIPVCSFVRDSFAAELFSDDCEESGIEKQRFFIYRKVAESIPEIKNHVGTSLVSMDGDDECLLVGLSKFIGCFQEKQSLSDMENAVDRAVDKALNGEFRPIPDWIQSAVIDKLEKCNVVGPGFGNIFVIGKDWLSQDVGSFERFKSPIVCLQSHTDCRLTFGSGHGYVNNLFSVPLLVGEVLSIEENSYAIKDVSHCIPDCDLLILGKRARSVSDWDFAKNVGDEPVVLLGSLGGNKQNYFWGQRVDVNVNSKPILQSKVNSRTTNFQEIAHSNKIMLKVSKKPIQVQVTSSGRKEKQFIEPDWSSYFRISCILTEAGKVEHVTTQEPEVDLVEWYRKEQI